MAVGVIIDMVNTRLRNKFPSRRQTITKLCVRHLQDKSSTVRKYTIRALTALITTHPFSMYGGELDLEEWQSKLDKIQEELEVTVPLS